LENTVANLRDNTVPKSHGGEAGGSAVQKTYTKPSLSKAPVTLQRITATGPVTGAVVPPVNGGGENGGGANGGGANGGGANGGGANGGGVNGGGIL